MKVGVGSYAVISAVLGMDGTRVYLKMKEKDILESVVIQACLSFNDNRKNFQVYGIVRVVTLVVG